MKFKIWKQISEKYGCWIWLCSRHHNGSTKFGIHFNSELDLKVKKLCQQKFEETIGNRTQFMILFGKSYL